MTSEIGELIKTTPQGTRRTKGHVDTSGLGNNNTSLYFASDTKKGFGVVFLGEAKGIPAGRYFIKEALPSDTDPIWADDGSKKIQVESRQLLRYQRLKETGARVPPTFRKYVEKGKVYFITTDLGRAEANLVWGVTDVEKIDEARAAWIKWDELASDMAENAARATNSRVLTTQDTHIIVVSPEHSWDYLADLDRGTYLYGQEEETRPEVMENYSLRALNITEAWKALIKFPYFIRRDAEIPRLCGVFWEKIKAKYPNENPRDIAFELLEKAWLSVGIPEEYREKIKDVLQQDSKMVR